MNFHISKMHEASKSSPLVLIKAAVLTLGMCTTVLYTQQLYNEDDLCISCKNIFLSQSVLTDCVLKNHKTDYIGKLPDSG